MTKRNTTIIEAINTYIAQDDTSYDLRGKRTYIMSTVLNGMFKALQDLENKKCTVKSAIDEILDQDNQLDSTGGFGNGGFDRQGGMGLPTDYDTLDTMHDQLTDDIETLASMYSTEKQAYKIATGKDYIPYATRQANKKVFDRKKALEKYGA